MNMIEDKAVTVPFVDFLVREAGCSKDATVEEAKQFYARLDDGTARKLDLAFFKKLGREGHRPEAEGGTVPIYARVHMRQLGVLDALAKARGFTRSRAVDEIILDWLKIKGFGPANSQLPATEK
jgi:hypothetical protein